MSLSTLGSLLESVPQFQQLQKSLIESHANPRAQVLANAVPFTLATLWKTLGIPILVVTPRPEDARRLHSQLITWSERDDSVLHFPEAETLPFERLASDADTIYQRLHTLSTLTNSDAPAPIIVASASAIAQKTIDKEAFVSSSHTLQRNDQIDLDELLDLWRRMGYQFEAAVYGPGFVSRRGGIIDIFPVGATMPARIELWGNEIDSIRLFDPSSQRSTDIVDSISVIPAQETLPALTKREHLDRMMSLIDVSNCTQAARDRMQEEFNLLLDGYEVEDVNFYAGFFNRGSILDYFPENGLLVRYAPSDIAEAAWDIEERTHQLREVKEQRGELPLYFPSSHFLWEDIEQRATRFKGRLDILRWGDPPDIPLYQGGNAGEVLASHDQEGNTKEELPDDDYHVLPFASTPAFLGKLDSFVEEVDELAKGDHRVVAVTSHSRRLGEILADYGVEASLPESLTETPPAGSITVLQNEGVGLGDGFVLNVDGKKLTVLGDTEIFGVAKQRRSKRRISAMREAFLSELTPGDYVVHVEHGIGQFSGTGSASKDGDGPEHLIIKYAQGDKLYVPLEHLDRVTPYIAALDHPPSLTRLGTQEWNRTKAQVMRSTREMAAELLTLYAERELAEGFAFGQDTHWQAELEESFPFEETPDQLSTLAEVKADMESSKPMDRLVCGDVGYGKTEIALRAAFKAVMEGKQVAMLVPTTVLAQQHYATFSQRLSAFPTRVEVLSRFRTDKEQRDIIEALATGSVDICIGTHRLIQRDVVFKELGLIIIDEEQRFGVAHKERLKQMRKEVDVLTLTATPIPRTLHMSLAGVRDMSTIDTPPEERLPIKTYVSEFSDELIREAILREIDRQGQVYFLHNRVYNIDYMANYVKKLVPEAEIAIAHGQMPEGELENVMLDFAEGKMDVLMCTTIIESGLDIPNVNTLIVNRADAFGLAQLYQLRGRVGRSERRAYSYLLIPKAASLTEAAEQRLKAMLAATELGAGFRIAMKDLEIRGAGNILGSQQSGHIHAVGFELYTRMLSNAVEELRALRAAGEDSEQNGNAATQAIASAFEPDDATGKLATDTLKPTDAVTVDLNIPASMPEEYIADLPARLGLYQRLIKLTELAEIDELEDELRDRFGPLPWQVQNLLYVVKLKLQAHKAGIEAVSRDRERIVLQLRHEVGGAKRALKRVFGPEVEIGNAQIRIRLDYLSGEWEPFLMDTVTRLADFMEKAPADMAAVAQT